MSDDTKPDYIEVNFLEDGVLWALNRTLFHPRGFALGYDDKEHIFVLYGDGNEPWQYAESVSDVEQVKFDQFEALLARAKEALG